MANEPDPKKDPKADPEGNNEPDPKDPPKADPESVESVVRRVLGELLPEIVDDGDNGQGGPAAGGDGGGAGGAHLPPSPASVELHAEHAVRAAMDKLRKEGETEERIAKVEKAIKEEAPRTYKRLTRMFWGDDQPKKKGASA